jgi:hypothetical protein
LHGLHELVDKLVQRLRWGWLLAHAQVKGVGQERLVRRADVEQDGQQAIRRHTDVLRWLIQRCSALPTSPNGETAGVENVEERQTRA